MHVLIAGGGAIGASLAYALTARGAAVTLVERHAVAGAASGKSGGFLALDWCDGTPVEALARRSFALHAEWADQLGDDWGYRRVETYAGLLEGLGRPRRGTAGPAWIAPDVRISGRLGGTDTTAQVHPAAFTMAMMRRAERQGARLRFGTVTGLLRRGETVTGAMVDGEPLEADAVVVTLGPWSILAARWLSLPPVMALKGHSIVFRPSAAVPAEALFLEAVSDGERLSPEVFPRRDGTVYVCAISTEPPLPVDPAHVAPDRGAIDRLAALCGRIAPVLADAPIEASGACFRPIAPDGLPLIGPVPGAPGAFVATAHSVWGILNAPATAEAMTQLLLDGAARLDLAAFDPARMPPLDPALLVSDDVRS